MEHLPLEGIAVPEESGCKVTGVQRPKPPSPGSLEFFLGFLLEHVVILYLAHVLVATNLLVNGDGRNPRPKQQGINVN